MELDSGRNGAVGREELMYVLARLAEYFSSWMLDTGELHVTIFQRNGVFDTVCPDFPKIRS